MYVYIYIYIYGSTGGLHLRLQVGERLAHLVDRELYKNYKLDVIII